MAGLERVPAIVRHEATEGSLLLGLIENLQREDLNPVDEARALKEVMTIENLTTTGLAGRVHRSQGYIDERLRLLRHEDVEEAVETGLLTRSAGAAIASIRSADARQEWLERARQMSDPEVTGVKMDPQFDTLHGDPRFAKLLAAIGMAQ